MRAADLCLGRFALLPGGKQGLKTTGKSHAGGFSLLELTIVLAMLLVVSAVALPNMMDAIYNLRLRAAANSVAGLLQQARFSAVRGNTSYGVLSATLNGARIFYVDLNKSSSYSISDPAVQLGGNVQPALAAGPALPALEFPLQPTTSAPYFNAHGLPCFWSGSVCQAATQSSGPSNIAGYQLLLTDSRPMGASGWVWIVVTPAGRTRIYTWNGGAWDLD